MGPAFLSCDVSAFFKGYEEVAGPNITSPKDYYAGIRLFPKGGSARDTRLHITLVEGAKEVELVAESTLPLTGDSHGNSWGTGTANLAIKLSGNGVLGTGTGTCQVNFHENDWNSRRSVIRARETFKLIANRDAGFHKKDRTRIIRFNVTNFFQFSIWDGYRPEEFIVKLKDTPTKMCMSINDPWIYPLQGSAYLHKGLGEYVLLNSTKYNFEVHIRTHTCTIGAPSCNCAIAAREDNVVFIIDVCHNHKQTTVVRPHVKIRSDGDIPDGAHVSSNDGGTSYMINFPSGRFIKVDVRYFGLKVYIHLTQQDIHAGGFTGLCANRYDMSVQQQDMRFRLNKCASWFDNDPPSNNKPKGVYCKCTTNADKSTQLQCSFRPGDEDPSTRNQRVVLASIVQGRCRALSGRRKRREISAEEHQRSDDISEYDDYVFDYDKKSPNIPDPVWPTPKKRITKAAARMMCKDAMTNSSIFSLCRKVPSFDVYSAVPGCVADIKLTEDTNYIEQAVLQMEQDCLQTAVQEIVDDEDEDEHGHSTKPPKVHTDIISPELIMKNTCPNLCSKRGDCVKGTCVCTHPYTSKDCSVDMFTAPEIESVYKEGLCDVDERPCLKFRFMINTSTPITRSENLTCRTTEVKIDIETGKFTVLNHTTGYTKGDFISFGEITCPMRRKPILPPSTNTTRKGTPAQGILISVSNDGVRFGKKEAFITIYDSTCISCKPNGHCKKKPGQCLIDGYCYQDKERNPNNYCFQQCKAGIDAFKWQAIKPPVNTFHMSNDRKKLSDCFCNNTNNSPTWHCVCKKGYVEQNGNCVDVDECAHPDLNNCDRFYSKCVNLPGSYKCDDQMCPIGFTPKDNRCYYFATQKATFFDAYRLCKSKGGLIADFNNKREYKSVTRKWNQSREQYFLGLNDWQEEGTFVYADETKWNGYGEFRSPPHESEENCVAFDPGNAFMWSMVDCYTPLHFFCEAAKKNVV